MGKENKNVVWIIIQLDKWVLVAHDASMWAQNVQTKYVQKEDEEEKKQKISRPYFICT